MVKVESKEMRLGSIVLISGFFMLHLFGCACVKEKCRGILGVSTKILEDKRAQAIKKTFTRDYATCYAAVREVLVKNGSVIYAEDAHKGLIAVYVSEQNTTPVGIFFTKSDDKNTLIEVSSPSTYAKNELATKVFSDIENPHAKEEKGPTDAEKSTVNTPAY